MSRLTRLIRIVVNSIAFVGLLMLAYAFWSTNPLLSIFLVAAAFDQLEDVYYYAFRRRLIPEWLMPLDIIFELAVLGLGIAMLVFVISYFGYFESFLFRSLLILSIPIIWSAVEDIAEWGRGGRYEVREAGRFVRRTY